MHKIKFLTIAIKDYRVAAFAPTSGHVIRRIVGEITPRDMRIVEYGAGDGVITKEILKTLSPAGTLIAVELNKEFASELRNIRDPRLRIINDDVSVVSGKLCKTDFPSIDVVVSGIPFSYLSPAKRNQIVENTHRALCERGRFIVDQHSLFMLPILRKTFRAVSWRFEPRNFPPHFTMIAEK